MPKVQFFLFAFAAICHSVAGQDLVGGIPPRPAEGAECYIDSLFRHLQEIKSAPECTAGCAGGHCPDDWYPGVSDSCSPECGQIYETFWDECGNLLMTMRMQGMEGMAAFYDECLQVLYPPGKCGLFCNQHTYECMLDEVQHACCDEGGANCGHGEDIPLTCPVGCALVWPEFTNICHDHIEQDDAMELTEYTEFTERCLENDGMALVEYAMELRVRGCRIDLAELEGTGRRQMQGLLTQWIGSSSMHCVWEEIDDLAEQVDRICCGEDGSGCHNGPPDQCSMACMLEVHQFTNQCGLQIENILGSHRYSTIEDAEQRCVEQVDIDAFMDILAEAECPDANGEFPEPVQEPEPSEPEPEPSQPVEMEPSPLENFTMIDVDGVMHDERVDFQRETEYFGFQAQEGRTYSIDTELEPPYTLPDSVLQLLGTDGTTVIAENDDDPRSSMLYDSYIEWTCPESGLYYAAVREYGRELGTFGISITEADSLGQTARGGGDPCRGGAILTEDNAVISFQPEGNYDHDMRCTWHVMCPAGNPRLTLQEFETEEGYDIVDIFDGDNVHATELASLSGHLDELGETVYRGTGSDMFIEFSSDSSIADRGFTSNYICDRH